MTFILTFIHFKYKLGNMADKETQVDYSIISREESGMDIYNAVDEQSGEVVLVVVHGGEEQPKINISSSRRIVWISREPMGCFQETERWECFFKSQECVALILLFNRSLELVELLSSRSDVVAIYPSTKVEVVEEKNVVMGVFRVVVKAVGYIPIGENPIPNSIQIDGSIIDIEVQQGYINWCGIKSGDGIAFEKDSSGYGTIGGVAIRDGKYYAVTNEHVLNGSSKNTHWGTYSSASYLCSPSKGWTKLQLLRHLQQPTFDVDGEFIANVDSVLIDCISTIKTTQRVHNAMKKVSAEFTIYENNDISIKQLVDFAKYSQCRIGQNIIRLEWDVSTSHGMISGDVALIEFEDKEQVTSRCVEIGTFGLDKVISAWKSNKILGVSKTGASSGCTQGILARPIHTKSPTCLKESKLKNTNEKCRILQNQIIIHGYQFGRKGDSGSAVLHHNDEDECEIVGIFTGSIGDSLYLCSPAEILSENSFNFAIIEDA